MSFGSELTVEGKRGKLVMGPLTAEGLDAWPPLGSGHPMFSEIGPQARAKLAGLWTDRAGFVQTLGADDGTVHWGLHREGDTIGLASLQPSPKRGTLVGRVL